MAQRAGERLAAADRRARWRDDLKAAEGLLRRALELIRPYRLDIALELDLAHTLPLSQGALAADAAAARAREIGHRPSEALARAFACFRRSWLTVDPDVDAIERLANEALTGFDDERDHAELAHVWDVLAWGVANARARFEDMARASEQTFRHARLAGFHQWQPMALESALLIGPRPADEALQTLDDFYSSDADTVSDLTRAGLLTMLGRVEDGLRLGMDARQRLNEIRGKEVGTAAFAEISWLAGDRALAVEEMHMFCARLERRGQVGNLSYYAPRLGRLLCLLERYEEAEPFVQRGREITSAADLISGAAWRQAQALIDSSRGRHAEAATLAREAVEIAEQTDSLDLQGDAYNDLAEVLTNAGKKTEAIASLEKAVDRYGRKKNLAMLAQVRPRLEALHREL